MGDVHGNWQSLFMAMDYAMNNIGIDAVFQVGDFGFYPGAIKTLIHLKKPYEFDKIPIHFIDGNHEDHKYLFEANKKNLEENNIFFHPRGSIWEVDGKKIGCMGGAFNVDRPQEVHVIEKEDGMVQRIISNYPMQDDIDAFADKVNAIGEDRLDVMVTHGCPGGVNVGVKGSRYFLESAQEFIVEHGHAPMIYNLGDVGEYPLTRLWNSIEYKPRKWVFGHYHKIVYSYVDGCTFHCISCCDTRFDDFHFFIYDTELDWLSEVKVRL